MRKLVSGILMLLALLNAEAQGKQNDVTADSMIAIYNAQRNATLPIFNGRQFIGYSHLIQGFPYFLSSEWQNGSVLYEGVWYNDLSLMYDAHQDQVVVRSPNGFPYILISDRVEEFVFSGQRFLRITESGENKLKTGFYQLLATGDARVLAKRSKKLEEKITGSEVDRKFIPADKFYIIKNKTVSLIDRQKDLLDALKEKRDQVQNLIRTQELRFKSNPELTIVRSVELYNQSTN